MKRLLRGIALSALTIAAVAIPLLYGRDKRPERSDTTLGLAPNIAIVVEQQFDACSVNRQRSSCARCAQRGRRSLLGRGSSARGYSGTRVVRGRVIARLDPEEAEARVAQTAARIAELEATVRQSTEDFARFETLVTASGAMRQEVLAVVRIRHGPRAAGRGALRPRPRADSTPHTRRPRTDLGRRRERDDTRRRNSSRVVQRAHVCVAHRSDKLECVALVDEADIAHATPGDSGRIHRRCLSGRVFHGVVTRVAPDATT